MLELKYADDLSWGLMNQSGSACWHVSAALQQAYLTQTLHLVNVLIATIISCAWQSLRVLVGHAGSDSLHDLQHGPLDMSA